MNRQQKTAFFIGILGIIILDVCWVRSRLEYDYIFHSGFTLYKYFQVDYFYHIGLLMIFLTFVLLINGNKGYKYLEEKIDEVLKCLNR